MLPRLALNSHSSCLCPTGAKVTDVYYPPPQVKFYLILGRKHKVLRFRVRGWKESKIPSDITPFRTFQFLRDERGYI